MAPLFGNLALWTDTVARDGPEQMACDEWLLGHAEGPVLRVFRWAQPWVSAGCFVPWQLACAVRVDLPVCRRWTGGGVVVHENDFTFALVSPRDETWARSRPEESYRLLHTCLNDALGRCGLNASLAQGADAAGRDCFAAPVRHDIMEGGRKIAGGAQRRTKRGLLHQGSVQAACPEVDFARLLAETLAAEITTWSAPDRQEEEISALTRTKYASDKFLRKETL